MYGDPAPPVDPYADAYNAPPSAAPAASEPRENGTATRGRSRSRSPARSGGYRSPYRRRSPPPPAATKRPSQAPVAPNPSSVLGVFGLSIRTQERDLDEEFSRFGRVEKVTIVYDQRSDRSRGFGFIRMSTVDEAARCIQELNGVELNGRRIRVDYSVTDRPHNPTPGTLATLIGTAILVAAATVTKIVTHTDATAATGVIVEALLPPEVVATPPITEEDAVTQEARRGVPRPVPADMMPLPVATLDATKVVRLHRTFIASGLPMPPLS
ncbi:hypothetical protein CCMSSC00406_0005299 [Pleurotus cornucopiae]|uniref:Uncharacterized protein n=1 Tax=Pleurotus cornucopiae TaxID=5321 RepID=A0ACB7INZ2_PLECO|nr:hypothetical protein CCMSSC00406_0005299 [Pleurotus cornucopiae]